MNSMLRSSVAIAVLAATTSCSAVMAGSGTETPDLSVLKKGASRETIHAEFGTPARRDDRGRVEYFYTELGDPPDGARAADQAVLAVLSLGTSELILTPAEAARQKDVIPLEIIVEYDGDRADRIVIQDRKPR